MSIYGEAIPLACAGIINKVSFMFFSVCIGIGQGMQPIISFNYGAKQYGRVKRVLKLSLSASTVICVIAFLLFQIFPREIIGFFGDGSELYFAFAQKYFRIYMFCTFLNNIQPLSSNFFTSIGKPAKGTFLGITRQLLCLMPLIIVLPRLFGIDGLMFAGPIADFLAAAIAVVMLISEHKNMDRLEDCNE
jgi:Na+-driven multidrug efflux pump